MDYTIFNDELNLIENESIKNFTLEALKIAPKYFFDVPSSVSGKYHPYCNNGKYGLIMHTKLCVNAGKEIFDNPLLINELANKPALTKLEEDICISSILIHDICKYGTNDTIEAGSKSRKDHPILAGEILKNSSSLKNLLDSNIKSTIVKCVERHTGPWVNDRNGNKILEEPKHYLEKIVHLMDYFGSRKDLMDSSLNRFFVNNNIPTNSSNINFINANEQ
ncbi:MAG: HD domain-containing protein [Clostridia bacterium]|jgi:hypothetical protein|nr:HD domain-containing protein [Clostridia bacterium]